MTNEIRGARRMWEGAAWAAMLGGALVWPSACGSDRTGDDDDDIGGDGDADADADADADLRVELLYTTFCDDGACATADHELVGRNGEPIPDRAGAELGIECDVEVDGTTATLSSLQVLDSPIGGRPSNGLRIGDATLRAGSQMSCGGEGFTLLQFNEFSGGCGGLTDGQCAIGVSTFDEESGRIVMEIDCQSLIPRAGTTRRSVRQGLLTLQGCAVR
jgi:hypothetical protein